MKINNESVFVSHILDEYPKEAVGILKDKIYSPLPNVSSNPVDAFSLSESESFRLAQIKDYVLIHSHTKSIVDEDPRTPSLADMETQQNLGAPCAIVYCDGENISEPLLFGPPSNTSLLGRTYIHNVYDCFTLARDYYYRYFGVDLGVHPRQANWEDWNPYYIEQTYEKLGFISIGGQRLQKGDVLLLRITSTIPNHIGVFIEDDIFIHHLNKRKSLEDSVKKWSKQIVKVLRYARR